MDIIHGAEEMDSGLTTIKTKVMEPQQENQVTPNSYQLQAQAIKALKRGDFKQACMMQVMVSEVKIREMQEDLAYMKSQLAAFMDNSKAY